MLLGHMCNLVSGDYSILSCLYLSNSFVFCCFLRIYAFSLFFSCDTIQLEASGLDLCPEPYPGILRRIYAQNY